MADKRLIDANALTRWLEMNKSNAHPLDYSTQGAYAACITMVGAMETIDAVKVVHGRWVTDIYNMKTYETETVPFESWKHSNAYCSVCKADALCNGHEEDVPSRYCPNCGAKMDGGAEG